jgi:hypothetical protein
MGWQMVAGLSLLGWAETSVYRWMSLSSMKGDLFNWAKAQKIKTEKANTQILNNKRRLQLSKSFRESALAVWTIMETAL